MNNFTKYLSFAIDFLFIKQPARTSIGMLFGAATKYLITLLAIWIVDLQVVVTLNIPIWGYMLLGLTLFHIPTALRMLFGKYTYLSENEEKLIAMISKSKFTDYEKQQLYLRLVEKVLETVELAPELRSEIDKMSRQ